MTRRPARDDIVAALFVAALTAALLALAYVGLYARYMADDYCTAASLHKLGFLAFQRRWYMEWTGRFSFSLALAAAESVGPAVVPFLPLSAVVCWVAGAGWSVYRLAARTAGPWPVRPSRRAMSTRPIRSGARRCLSSSPDSRARSWLCASSSSPPATPSGWATSPRRRA